LLVLPAAGARKRNEKKESDAFAVISGTVYRPPGFALPGAEVVIAPDTDAPGSDRIKKQKVITDARGEFSVRVPTVPMRYTIHVKSGGYVSQQKPASIEGEQRRELTFQMEPEPSSGK
jgi:hypothetical protein